MVLDSHLQSKQQNLQQLAQLLLQSLSQSFCEAQVDLALTHKVTVKTWADKQFVHLVYTNLLFLRANHREVY